MIPFPLFSTILVDTLSATGPTSLILGGATYTAGVGDFDINSWEYTTTSNNSVINGSFDYNNNRFVIRTNKYNEGTGLVDIKTWVTSDVNIFSVINTTSSVNNLNGYLFYKSDGKLLQMGSFPSWQYSTDGGSSWIGMTHAFEIREACENNSNMVCGITLEKAYITDDLTKVTASSVGHSSAIRDIAFGNGYFIVACESSTIAKRSTDGINWSNTGTLGGITRNWRNVSFSPTKGEFLITTFDGYYAKSATGSTWSNPVAAGFQINKVVWSSAFDKWYLYNGDVLSGTTDIWSYDGTTFTKEIAGISLPVTGYGPYLNELTKGS